MAAARTIDITERLGLAGRPAFTIAGKRYEIDNTTATVAQLMSIIGDGTSVTPDKALEAITLLVGAESAEFFWTEYPFDDFMVVLEVASDLATGNVGDGGAEGNAETPATT